MPLSPTNAETWMNHAAHTIGDPIAVSVEAAMTAARSEGEEAGTVKAEQAAAETIARLEARLLAVYVAATDAGVALRCNIHRDANRIQATLATAEVNEGLAVQNYERARAAEGQLDHAIERARRAEAEVERLKLALFDALNVVPPLAIFTKGMTPAEIEEFKAEWRAMDQGRPIAAPEPAIWTPAGDRRRLDAIARRAGELVDAPATSPITRRLADLVASLATAAAAR